MKSHGFLCEHCGGEAKAASDHCPVCLWSKHTHGAKGGVCQGQMQPLNISLKETVCMITYRCLGCGHESRRRAVVQDNFEALTRLSIRMNEVCNEEATQAFIKSPSSFITMEMIKK